MAGEETLSLVNREDWRKWLGKYHRKKSNIWLIYFKKHTKKQTIPYNDAVEEAICFGWIDGKVKSIDKERYMQRYTPRKPASVWSLANKKRALKMMKEGKMTSAGLATIKNAKKTGKWQAAYSSKAKPAVPPALKKVLEKNRQAKKNFYSFTNAQQFQYIYWILQAKQEETRKRRAEVVVKRCEINKKPGEM